MNYRSHKSLILMVPLILFIFFPPASYAQSGHVVRPVILIPNNYSNNISRQEIENNYKPRVIRALKDVQKFYADKLNGHTFRLDENVDVKYLTNSAIENPKTVWDQFWALGGTKILPKQELVIYAVWILDFQDPINFGWQFGEKGYALMSHHNLIDLNKKGQEEWQKNRALGLIAHELGHTFNLVFTDKSQAHPCSKESEVECKPTASKPYPPADEYNNSVMGGWWNFPNNDFGNSEDNPLEEKLYTSLFLNPQQDPAPKPFKFKDCRGFDGKVDRCNFYASLCSYYSCSGQCLTKGTPLDTACPNNTPPAKSTSPKLPKVNNVAPKEFSAGDIVEILGENFGDRQGAIYLTKAKLPGNPRMDENFSSFTVEKWTDEMIQLKIAPDYDYPYKTFWYVSVWNKSNEHFSNYYNQPLILSGKDSYAMVLTANISSNCSSEKKPLSNIKVFLKSAPDSFNAITDQQGRTAITFSVPTPIIGIAYTYGSDPIKMADGTIYSKADDSPIIVPNPPPDILEKDIIFHYPKCPQQVSEARPEENRSEDNKGENLQALSINSKPISVLVSEDGDFAEGETQTVNPNQGGPIEWKSPDLDNPIFTRVVYDDGSVKDYETAVDNNDKVAVPNTGIEVVVKEVKRITKITVGDREVNLDNPEIDIAIEGTDRVAENHYIPIVIEYSDGSKDYLAYNFKYDPPQVNQEESIQPADEGESAQPDKQPTQDNCPITKDPYGDCDYELKQVFDFDRDCHGNVANKYNYHFVEGQCGYSSESDQPSSDTPVSECGQNGGDQYCNLQLRGGDPDNAERYACDFYNDRDYGDGCYDR